jgi:tetratricopeptide (TPR) repeat protein
VTARSGFVFTGSFLKNSRPIDLHSAQTLPIAGPWLGWIDHMGALARWLAWLRQIFSEAPARLAFGVFALMALVLVVYLPLLPGSFVMDDARLVGEQANPLVNGQLTLRSVWFQTDFPLTLCAWWVEWSLWGNQPLGYHIVNIVLQAISAVLLWRALARLRISGAWLGAAMFAVHPVAVGSVARIAELKNTLSLPFFLLSFWAYLRYERVALYGCREATGNLSFRSGTGWFVISFVACIFALLSKTTVVMLPMAMMGCAAWQRGRITRRDVIHTAPFFLLAIAFGLMSIWFQRYQALAGEIVPAQSLVERLGIAGRDFWFYLGKVVLPINLTVFYSRWRTDLSTLVALMPVVATAWLFVLCWRFRRGWGRHALLGIGCFTILLFPSLGFFDAQCFTKFQVSDHLQYLPLIALTSLAGAALASIPNNRVFICGTIGVLLVLSLLSFQRARVFSTEEGLLRDTLAKNPAAWPAHNDLGVILARQGKISAAADEFNASLRWKPNEPGALANLAQCDAAQGRFAAACAEYRTALRLKPDSAAWHESLAGTLQNLGDNVAAIGHLKIALRLAPKTTTRLALADLLFQTRDYRAAAGQYREALLAEPDNVTALNNFAFVLASCPDGTVRNGGEAVTLAERACRLTKFKKRRLIRTLAAAYAGQGRMSEAAEMAKLASRLQLNAANEEAGD